MAKAALVLERRFSYALKHRGNTPLYLHNVFLKNTMTALEYGTDSEQGKEAVIRFTGQGIKID